MLCQYAKKRKTHLFFVLSIRFPLFVVHNLSVELSKAAIQQFYRRLNADFPSKAKTEPILSDRSVRYYIC